MSITAVHEIVTVTQTGIVAVNANVRLDPKDQLVPKENPAKRVKQGTEDEEG